VASSGGVGNELGIEPWFVDGWLSPSEEVGEGGEHRDASVGEGNPTALVRT